MFSSGGGGDGEAELPVLSDKVILVVLVLCLETRVGCLVGGARSGME